MRNWVLSCGYTNVGHNCKKMNPQTLYHFTKADTAIRKILPNMNLRMNRLGNMNDPKENLLHITDLDDNIKDTLPFSDSTADEYVIALKISDETKIVSFSIDAEIISNNVKQKINGSQLQRMWAQYGGINTGICIEIDYEEFIKENSVQIIELGIKDKKVDYNNFQFQGIPTPEYGQLHVPGRINESVCLCDFWKELQNNDKFVNERFFTKNRDWEGESEYRFLAFHKSSEEIFLSFNKSIRRIILGINFSRHYLPSIHKIIPKDKVFGLRLDYEGNFEIREI